MVTITELDGGVTPAVPPVVRHAALRAVPKVLPRDDFVNNRCSIWAPPGTKITSSGTVVPTVTEPEATLYNLTYEAAPPLAVLSMNTLYTRAELAFTESIVAPIAVSVNCIKFEGELRLTCVILMLYL